MFTLKNFVVLLMSSDCFCSHETKNNSDVIITYAGHAEAVGHDNVRVMSTEKTTPSTDGAGKPEESYLDGEEKPIPEPEPQTDVNEDKDEVVFIPNDEARQTDDESFLDNERTVGDLLHGGRTLNDIINRRNVFENTEPPQNPDVLFVTGKNNQLENIDDRNYRRSDNAGEVHREAGLRTEKKQNEWKKVDCIKLDCNRTRSAVCGGKLDGHTWRYRLFLNDCFMDKVNCGFKYDVNKYTKVPNDKCKAIAHAPAKHRNGYVFLPQPPMPPVNDQAITEATVEARRAMAARRSQNIELSGQYCAHACPLSCPKEYAPECALSNYGLKKVFVNHCSLDLDSCTNNVAWQQRPLGECIGNQQAELRQNRAFIGWMQRVGIIDAKGRFVHE